MVEPGKFREARDDREAQFTHPDSELTRIIPRCDKRVFVCHTRADAMTGVLRRLDTGANNSIFLGYRNRGGTLDVSGMLVANGQSPNKIAEAAKRLLVSPSL